MLMHLLRMLGLGKSLIAASGLLMAAWYGRKALKAGALVGGLLSAGVVYLLVVLVAGGGALALGWIHLDPAAFISEGQTALRWLLSHLGLSISNGGVPFGI